MTVHLSTQTKPDSPAATRAGESLWQSALYLPFGVYSLCSFAILVPVALVAAVLLPQLAQRRGVARWVARSYMRLSLMRLHVTGLERLPAERCVVVANHASYLDGLVMTAALPPRFSFVIKREMNSVPLAGTLLRRLGSEFVERVDRHKGASDARRVLRSASNGHSLVFFPEGTFRNEPGLMKFHAGAFVTAMRGQCAVVPVVIRGTRRSMPGSRLLPRPARIEVELLDAIYARAEDIGGAHDLRDRARAAIADRLNEPDDA